MSERRCVHPDDVELSRLVEQYSVEQLGDRFGVSGNAVRKWMRQFGISGKPRGYWAKVYAGKSLFLPPVPPKKEIEDDEPECAEPKPVVERSEPMPKPAEAVPVRHRTPRVRRRAGARRQEPVPTPARVVSALTPQQRLNRKFDSVRYLIE